MSKLKSINVLFFTLFIGLLSVSVLFSSCKKEPEVVTVTVTDTLFITTTDTITETIVEDAMTFILVRHAETTGGGADPVLSAAGLARAETLKNMLGNVSLNAVFSTNYNRTTQTATPTATDQGFTVENYDPFDLNPFIDANLLAYPTGVILVVGHSNTTPNLLNLLVGEDEYDDISELEYDNIYIVTVYEKGNATVLSMKYGE